MFTVVIVGILFSMTPIVDRAICTFRRFGICCGECAILNVLVANKMFVLHWETKWRGPKPLCQPEGTPQYLNRTTLKLLGYCICGKVQGRSFQYQNFNSLSFAESGWHEKKKSRA